MDAQAHRVAQQLARGSVHTMLLEQQGVDAEEARAQVEALAAEIKRKMHPSMWEAS